MKIKEKLGDNLNKAEGVFVTYYMNKNSFMANFVDINGAELMGKVEALCNKSADTILDILYDNDLPVGGF